MPSDKAPFYLSHPRVLLSESEIYRKIRQEINLKFYEQYKGQKLIGGLFYIETGEHKVKLPNIYSRTYYTFLIENLEEYARRLL